MSTTFTSIVAAVLATIVVAMTAALLVLCRYIRRNLRADRVLELHGGDENSTTTSCSSKNAFANEDTDVLANAFNRIRTDLNGVLGMNSLLMAMDLAPKQRRYAELTRKSARSLLGVIDNVRDYAALREGKLSLQCVPFMLGNLIDEVVQGCMGDTLSKDVELVCCIDPDLPDAVSADAVRLRQIMTTLVDHAIAHTNESAVSLRVKANGAIEDIVEVSFELSDRGNEVAPRSTHNHIPDNSAESELCSDSPASEAIQSPSPANKQSSLDLEMCTQLAKLMDGRLTITNSEDGRASYSLLVTLKIEQAGKQAHPDSEPSQELGSCRILLVDSNPSTREICQEQFALWHVPIKAAANGQNALRILRDAAKDSAPIDIAIIDEHLADMNYDHLVQLIQCDPALSHTKLVLAASPTQVPNANSCHFDSHLTKPLWQAKHRVILASTLHLDTAHAEDSPGQSQDQPQADAHENEGSPQRTTRILIAEDNRINQMVVKEMLAKHGYLCDVVSTGRQAIDLLETKKFDLILMDCQMPQMDGLEATRAIRQAEKDGVHTTTSTNGIPIIALTGNALEGDRARCIDAGMDDYLTKPIDPKQLVSTVASLLARRNAAAEPPDQCTTDSSVSNSPDMNCSKSPASGEYNISDLSDIANSPIDVTDALHRCMGDEELLIQILELFSAETEEHIQQLGDAVAAKDIATLESIAHALKGAAVNVSVAAVHHAACELEQMARENNLDAAQDTLDQLGEDFNHYQLFLPTITNAIRLR